MTNKYNFKYTVGEEVIVKVPSIPIADNKEDQKFESHKGTIIWAIQAFCGPAYKVHIPKHSECVWGEDELEKLPEPSSD